MGRPNFKQSECSSFSSESPGIYRHLRFACAILHIIFLVETQYLPTALALKYIPYTICRNLISVFLSILRSAEIGKQYSELVSNSNLNISLMVYQTSKLFLPPKLKLGIKIKTHVFATKSFYFFLGEKKTFLRSLFCCNQRKADLKVVDRENETVMWLEHPTNCNWPICCPYCRPAMVARSSSGHILGYVEHA